MTSTLFLTISLVVFTLSLYTTVCIIYLSCYLLSQWWFVSLLTWMNPEIIQVWSLSLSLICKPLHFVSFSVYFEGLKLDTERKLVDNIRLPSELPSQTSQLEIGWIQSRSKRNSSTLRIMEANRNNGCMCRGLSMNKIILIYVWPYPGPQAWLSCNAFALSAGCWGSNFGHNRHKSSERIGLVIYVRTIYA